MFRTWSAYLPDWVELRAVLLPGRQSRWAEPCFEQPETAASTIAEWLSAETDPYALFGHSMGALLAYRTTHILVRRRYFLPQLLAVAAWPVHGARATLRPAGRCADEAIWSMVRLLGGAPAEVLDDREFRELTLPTFRADFTLCDRYVYRESEPTLPLSVAVYGGEDDPLIPPAQLLDWKGRAVRVFGPQVFPGGHFFFQDNLGSLVRALCSDVERTFSSSSARDIAEDS
jgi:surfactin synthase thioesterase subunit